jgi:RNA polymerase sigma factor (sigma-70 family)
VCEIELDKPAPTYERGAGSVHTVSPDDDRVPSPPPLTLPAVGLRARGKSSSRPQHHLCVNFPTAIGEGLAVGYDRTDASVISASLRNPKAFAEIFERHFDLIYGFIARRVGVDFATDIASDVFLSAFERRSRFDTARSNALPWLYGIAANKLRRHRRSEARRLRALAKNNPAVEEAADPQTAAMEPVVASALLSLQHADREVLLLFTWAEFSYEEIAEALTIPVGTVRSRLHRARRQLRTALEPGSQTNPSEEVPRWTN